MATVVTCMQCMASLPGTEKLLLTSYCCKCSAALANAIVAFQCGNVRVAMLTLYSSQLVNDCLGEVASGCISSQISRPVGTPTLTLDAAYAGA